MTIYLLGGSSTVMSGGWADSFATRMVRRYPVRNLAIGGGNTLMSLIRLTQEVSLSSGDIVVWASSVRDAMCLSAGGYQDGGLLRYTEELIRHVGDAGARFIPLLMDTWARDMDLRQPAYKQSLLELLEHYRLDWIDVSAEFTREAGLPRIPMGFYDPTGHIKAGSEMTRFISDLTSAAIEQDQGCVQSAKPLFVDPARPTHLIGDFAPPDLAEPFAGKLLTKTLWQPGVTLPPEARPEGPLDLEALVVMADPSGGAFELATPEASVKISACTAVDFYKGRMLLIAYLPNLIGTPLRIEADATLRLDWSDDASPACADLLFHPDPALGKTRARLASMIVRPAA